MSKILRRVLACLGIACFVGALPACGGGGGGATAQPPTIAEQPTDVSVDDGASVQFAVTAKGEPPLSFQWRRNGVTIAGATLSSYRIPAAVPADSGATFTVTVEGPGGSATSRAATLTVRPVLPSLTAAPQDANVSDGGTATFVVSATGSAPLAYQWLRNRAPIDGATSSTLTTQVLGLADHGASYSVIVSNVAGSITSPEARLGVAPVAPSILVAPAAVTARDGATVTLSVMAGGSGPLAYQWFDASGPIAGATQAQYSFTAVFSRTGVAYRVEVGNSLGKVSSAGAKVTVDPNAPSIDSAPAGVAVSTGASPTFSVSASGSVPLSYAWERSDDAGATWQPIAGATQASLSLPQVTLHWADARVRVRVSNAAGSVTSVAARLGVTPDVHILAGAIGGPGFANGVGEAVRFNFPRAAVADAAGIVYVTDTNNRVIRRVAPGGATSVFVGPGPLLVPRAMAIDGKGRLFVEDAGTLRTVAPDGTVAFLAGGGLGSADGTGAAASFAEVVAIAADAEGNILLVDGGANQTVRRVTPSGAVTTLAGKAGQFGTADGPGAAARFTNLQAIAVDGTGQAYVADNQAIRRISPSGEVTLHAGLPGQPGTTDGPRLAARFNYISALGFDAEGNLYVAEAWQIRRIAANGVTTTLAGGTPAAAAVDGIGAAARISGVASMAALPSGQGMVIAEPSSSVVRRVTAGGVVSTLAGVAPRLGAVDAIGTAARLQDPRKVIVAPDGLLIVAELPGLRRIAASGAVGTIAKTGNLGTFSATDVARGPAGELYVADTFSHVIHRVGVDGRISVWAGTPGTTGSGDGARATATFYNPAAIAVDASGVVYVADSGNHTIRRIDTQGVVSTWAGTPGQCGGVDGVGAAARFCGPLGLTVGPSGDVFVADTSTHTIRRIGAGGVVSTYAGVLNSPGLSNGMVARFLNPRGLAFDAFGNLFVADTGNSLIRRITAAGSTSTVMGQAGTAALLPGADGSINSPTGIAVRPNGRLVVVSEQAVVGD